MCEQTIVQQKVNCDDQKQSHDHVDGVRQIGHPRPACSTWAMHDTQKCWCPHGTSSHAPRRGTPRTDPVTAVESQQQQQQLPVVPGWSHCRSGRRHRCRTQTMMKWRRQREHQRSHLQRAETLSACTRPNHSARCRILMRVSLMRFVRFLHRRIFIPRPRRTISVSQSVVVRCRWPRKALPSPVLSSPV